MSTQSAPIPAPAPTPAPMLLAALFDVDGTMADTDIFHRQVFRDLLQPFGIVCDDQYYNTHISGRSNALIAADLLPQLPVDEATQLFIHKEDLFRQKAESSLEPLRGLHTLLSALRQAGVKLAAVTNAPRPNVEMMLRVLNVADAFDLIVLGEECTEAKPSPVPYLEAMRRLGFDPVKDAGRCIVFEDSLPGITAGVRAGARVVGVKTTQNAEVLKGVGAIATIHHFDELIVEKMIHEMKDFVYPPNTLSSTTTTATANGVESPTKN